MILYLYTFHTRAQIELTSMLESFGTFLIRKIVDNVNCYGIIMVEEFSIGLVLVGGVQKGSRSLVTSRETMLPQFCVTLLTSQVLLFWWMLQEDLRYTQT